MRNKHRCLAPGPLTIRINKKTAKRLLRSAVGSILFQIVIR